MTRHGSCIINVKSPPEAPIAIADSTITWVSKLMPVHLGSWQSISRMHSERPNISLHVRMQLSTCSRYQM
ncbi:hypothetical protein WJX79_003127 [Trebouxia sp. C0005]